MEPNYIINLIKEVRAKNNDCWMDILKLAFAYAPNQAKEIFKNITENDAEINKLSKELSDA